MEEAQLSNYKLNWLRAAVLGANDGIVSVASIVLGVAGAHNDRHIIFIAGLAGLVAGAFSMAVGEYVSVSSQRDTERAYIAKEKQALQDNPEEELAELAQVYEAKGLSTATAAQVAKELTKHDVIKAHLDAELNINEEDLSNPSHAAIASAVSFTLGALVQLLTVVFTPMNMRIWITFVAVLFALVITGYLSATVGNASRRRAITRVVIGGALAMIGTYLVGRLFGTAVS
jgi:VIT1/CCC1 family predicted Fe2+/Mn2+ transporter